MVNYFKILVGPSNLNILNINIIMVKDNNNKIVTMWQKVFYTLCMY